jgi:hypothetical protein
MRSPLSGSIATCLIFVPLVAVPLLAVLGMPQLSANTPTAAGEDLKFAVDDSAQAAGNADLLAPVQVSGAKADSSAAPRESGAGASDSDPFAGFSRDSDVSDRRGASTGASAKLQKRSQRWLDEGNGLPQKALVTAERFDAEHASPRPTERRATRSPDDHAAEHQWGEAPLKLPATRRALPEAEAVVALADSTSASPPADPANADRASADPQSPSSRALTWKRAVARLNALGIRDFQLQAGEREGEFNFSCRFVSRTNPHVIHRFEAEAADPLDAVNQVLGQLDDWKARQAGRGGAIRTSATEGNNASGNNASGNNTSRTADSSEVELTNRAF